MDMLSRSPLCNHVTNLLNSFSLTQVVNEPTHFGHGDSSSLIDFVLMSAPETLCECVTVPPLANSDHVGICLQVKSHTNISQIRRKRRVIWRYKHTDFNRACDLLSANDLDSIFDESSIDACWVAGRGLFWMSWTLVSQNQHYQIEGVFPGCPRRLSKLSEGETILFGKQAKQLWDLCY